MAARINRPPLFDRKVSRISTSRKSFRDDTTTQVSDDDGKLCVPPSRFIFQQLSAEPQLVHKKLSESTTTVIFLFICNKRMKRQEQHSILSLDAAALVQNR